MNTRRDEVATRSMIKSELLFIHRALRSSGIGAHGLILNETLRPGRAPEAILRVRCCGVSVAIGSCYVNSAWMIWFSMVWTGRLIVEN